MLPFNFRILDPSASSMRRRLGIVGCVSAALFFGTSTAATESATISDTATGIIDGDTLDVGVVRTLSAVGAIAV